MFLPFQRDNVKRQGLGKQNGQTAAEAGDKFAQEASFVLNTNDPAGFNLIDVFAWGAIGHALGFFTLATSSLNAAGFDPKVRFRANYAYWRPTISFARFVYNLRQEYDNLFTICDLW